MRIGLHLRSAGQFSTNVSRALSLALLISATQGITAGIALAADVDSAVQGGWQTSSSRVVAATQPFPQQTRIELEATYATGFTGPDKPNGDGGAGVARLMIPFGQDRWLLRAQTGFGSAPDGVSGTTISGRDETLAQALYRFDLQSDLDVMLGLHISDAGKTDPALGTSPVVVGLAHGFYDRRAARYQWGYFGTLGMETQSAGDGRQGVIGTLQPMGNWVFPNGWYTGSQPTGSYDFERDILYIPASIRMGRVFETDAAYYDAWLEPEINVYSNDATFPEAQMRFGVNITLK
jgi:hypothetical protein